MAKKNSLDKALGQEIADLNERENYLRANADGIESLEYMKRFDPEKVTLLKNDLSDLSIIINDVEIDKKETAKAFSDQLKPLKKQKTELLKNIKEKAELVNERCYKFVDHDARMTGFYNSEGELVNARPMTPDEAQATIYSMDRQTGTNN
ncbi:MAG: hypothetical protein JZU53_07155 [Paludibacter sp.]|nr:hypothetical protein [Paludibacter sp.]